MTLPANILDDDTNTNDDKEMTKGEEEEELSFKDLLKHRIIIRCMLIGKVICKLIG